MDFLASPRRRRRVAWSAALLGVAAAAFVAVTALPEGKPLPPDELRPGAPVKVDRPIKMTPALRREINRTLDRFVPAAVERRNPALAWELSGPGMRAGSTRREWLTGSLPVFPYRYRRSQSLHGWQLAYAVEGRVAIDLMLQPHEDSLDGPIIYGVDLVERNGRWVVDNMFPSAVFSGKKERPWVVGPADFQAGATTAKAFYNRKPDRAHLSATWLAVPGAIVALVVLVPLLFWGRNFLADRRARAEWAAWQRARAAR